MKKRVSNWLIVVLLSAISASGQKYKTFAEHPSKRQEKAKQAQVKCAKERTDAREWARKKGIKVRDNKGRHLRELIAVRNGKPVYYSTKNFNAAISTGAYQVRNTAPYLSDGSGVTVGIWDGGSVLTTHTEFSGGRVLAKDGATSDYHATHIGGTIGASGVHPGAQGMAPNVHIDSYDWAGDGAEMTARAAAVPGDSTKLYLSNHSYGYITGWESDGDGSYTWYGESWNSGGVESYFGQYVEEAAQWDGIVYDAPYFLPFKSAGNDRNDDPFLGAMVSFGESGSDESYSASLHPSGDGEYKNGYDTLGPVGTAKNIITVGAVDKAVSGSARSVRNADMASFSSWGPADDGRIKPDIVAQGVSLFSCDNDDNTDYLTFSGTSMSSPNACGSAALLVDYYDNLFSGQAMRASTLKGLILHSADDLGRPGPDYSYGWGLMNTLAAASLIRDYAAGSPLRMTEGVLSGENRSDTYSIFSLGAEAIRVTLCWTDPPGNSTSRHDSRDRRLVNDLDLKLIGPDGTHYPYKLNYSSPLANATATSENDVDNVEQVYVEVPTIGEYTVLVDYDGMLRDGVQHYSLLIDGIGSDSDQDKIPDFWESLYFSNSTGAVAGVDSDGDGADNLTEYVSGHDPTDPESVFEVTSFDVTNGESETFVLEWEPVEGRVYNVLWTRDLRYGSFEDNDLSGDLPYPIGSYTDSLQRAGAAHFYRVDVNIQQ